MATTTVLEHPPRSSSLTASAAVGVAALTLLGLGLRAFLASRDSFWPDEAQFLFIVRSESVGAMIEFLRWHESHPPLLYLMMRGWLAAFGDTEVSAQAVPVLLGAALVPALYAVGSRTFGRRTGLVAALLGATSPLLIHYSIEVRPYALLSLLYLLSTYYLWSGLTRGGAATWAAYVAASLAMIWVHTWPWVALLGHWAVAVPWFVWHRTGRRVVTGWVVSQLAIGALYSPWLPTLLHQTRHAGYDGASSSAYLIAASKQLPMAIVGYPGSLPINLFVLTSVLVVQFCRWGFRVAPVEGEDPDRVRSALFVFVGAPLAAVVAAFALSWRSQLISEKNFSIVGPVLLLSVSYVISSCLPRRLAASAVVALGLALLFLATDLFASHPRSNAREIAKAVAERARPGDLIVVAPEWYATAFRYYYARTDTTLVYYPTEDSAGAIRYDDTRKRFLEPAAFDRLLSRLAEAHGSGRRVWLLLDRGSVFDPPPGRGHSEGLDRLSSYMEIGKVRANQIRVYLTELYGPPDSGGIEADPRKGTIFGQMFLRAFLFGDRPSAGKLSVDDHRGSVTMIRYE